MVLSRLFCSDLMGNRTFDSLIFTTVSARVDCHTNFPPRGPMGEYELQIDSEFDFVGMSFDGNAVVSDNRHLKLAVLPTELRVHSWRYRRVKRFIDIAGALLMLAL